MKKKARGYIASGDFNGNRVPQHLQNQIIKMYCDANNLEFILSRAEYWMNGGTQCQLWAALKEGIGNIVFFSIWQFPTEKREREKIYKYCMEKRIFLHFATERMSTTSNWSCFDELEILIESNLMMIRDFKYHEHLISLKKLVEEESSKY